MNHFGLNPTECELIRSVLERHSEVTEAKIFGSRAKGNFRPNSDIDLALTGPIPFAAMAAISGELEELPLPYIFDVEAYDSLRHEPLREHIDRIGKTFYTRAESKNELS